MWKYCKTSLAFIVEIYRGKQRRIITGIVFWALNVITTEELEQFAKSSRQSRNKKFYFFALLAWLVLLYDLESDEKSSDQIEVLGSIAGMLHDNVENFWKRFIFFCNSKTYSFEHSVSFTWASVVLRIVMWI